MKRTISASLSMIELAALHPIAEGRHAAHPHPLPLRGSDLVADALADDLALELGKEQVHIQGQPPYPGRWVELLRDRNEGRVSRIEDFDDLGKISQRAGESTLFGHRDHLVRGCRPFSFLV
jgi:hypothetical protein